ncbi:MAG: stage 0 sporulation family protein [Veillonella sp.]|nr:stage 0 sporulation family protein [Veillonella sp.]
MITVVGIRFKKAGKIYYFAPGGIHLALHDGVIVETARGLEFGTVVIEARTVEEDQVSAPLKHVLRKASPKDYKQLEKNKEKEEKAFAIGLEKISARGLAMKLINVEYTFDMNKIIFFFTADGRIDFRELVKDLAAVFRTRIELRQVGVRDEAKILNGIGACGRSLCCANHLGEFAPVSIKMAKDQNLSLNPTKISGACGRLMCCLNYEDDLYQKGGDLYVKRESKDDCYGVEPPGIGKAVVTEEGIGKVLKINRNKRLVKVQLDEGRTIDLKWSEVTPSDVGQD